MNPNKKLLVLALAASFGQPAQAATFTWDCNVSSYWDITSCWNPDGTPTSADIVNVGSAYYGGLTSSRTLTIDNTTANAYASDLNFDNTGSYQVSTFQTGGTLNVAGSERVGINGTGAFTQSGGTHSIVSTLYLGDQSAGNGSYTQTGGSLSASYEYIGRSGTGSFTQSGGTHTVNSLALGYNAGSTGSYTLSGTGSLSVANAESIGYGGTGTFTQSGGTHTVGNTLTLGEQGGGNGSYTLSGGTLTVGTIANGAGTGTLNLDGGTLTLTGSSIDVDNFRIGNAAGSNGSFTLVSGKSLTVTSETIGGFFGTGSFTQTGGTHTVSALLHLGDDGGNGSYTLSDGSLSAAKEYIGRTGTGSFTQSGGTNTVSGDFVLGVFSGSNGSYTLSGGTLTVGTIANGAGTGTLNLDGGTLTLTGSSIDVDNFRIGNAAGSNGSFTLVSGKSLTVANETIGVNGSGSFTQTGGTHTVGSLLINGDYTGTGGTLTVGTSLDNSGSFVLAGITISGTGALVNNAAMSGYGTIGGSGGFTNNGLFTQGSGDLTLSNTGFNANYGNFDLATARQLKLTGVKLDNGGTLNMNSTLVTGTGTLNNISGGTIAGRGSITTNFSNAGMVAVSGGTLNISKAFNNSGVIEMTGPTSSLAGGAINNTGTIQGYGNVSNAISNNGYIDAVGGSLNLSGTVNNNASGTIRASTGNKVLAVNGIASNTGLISLAGGTVDTNGNALNSAGKITGYGVLATGGLTNSGVMTLTGGTATVNGDVTNAAAGTIEVAYAPAVFTGAVVNNGLFKTTHTTATFAGSYTENGVFFSDPSSNYFTDVIISTNGYWIGETGDNFIISGNFVNNSLQSTLWSTNAASLSFTGTTTQDVYLAGSDLGASETGYLDNFAWGELSLNANTTLKIFDGNSESGAALYVGLIDLGGGLDQLAGISSDYNIYYDSSLAGNAYLGGKTYTLNGTGYLMAAQPVPEPEVWFMMLAGLGLVSAMARRRQQAQG